MEDQRSLRRATVADSIEMTKVEIPDILDGSPAIFSPDGNDFVIVVHRGNIQNNTNDYSLLLFRSGEAFHSPHPETLLMLSSSSNTPAISNVRWLSDKVLFLAQMPGKTRQIWSLDVKTRTLRPLTQHSTDVLAFDATSDLQTIAYLARPPAANLVDETSHTRGLLISDQRLADLIAGYNWDKGGVLASPPQLFLKRGLKGSSTRIEFQNKETLYTWFGVSLSPDGRFVVVLTDTYLYRAPQRWTEYKRAPGSMPNDFITYLVVDTENGSVRPLIDAPAYSGSIAWSNKQTAIVGATYLPLNIQDVSERAVRRTTTWTVEVNLSDATVTKIVSGSYVSIKYIARTGILVLKPLTEFTFSVHHVENHTVAYRKGNGKWHRVDPATAVAGPNADFEVELQQDVNMPPCLVVVRERTHDKSLLMDLNPQFRHIQFGHVEEITWKGTDGIVTKGGLYLPPDYVPGRTYPLIIQTHGWYPDKFEIDGFSTAGYAAQALAGEGFIVAQVPEANAQSSPLEGKQNMAMFEGLIDELSSRGLIDRNRVGLLGFSRTGYAVWYMLAFSKYPIAAAAVTDGSDGGYFVYIAELNQSEIIRDIYEGQNGAPPFGNGVQTWLKTSPGFNLDRIRTPVRQLGFGPISLQYNWESFVGLKRLGKAVEFVWLPDAAHPPVKPLERITAQQGNVDWFDFWLNGREDPDPAKTEQYARWRELRKLHEENIKKLASEPKNN